MTATPEFTYDPEDTIGQLRLQIQDTNFTTVTDDYSERSTWTCIFSDQELNSLLNQAGGRVLRAAALSMRAIAGSRSLSTHYQRVTIGADTVDLGDYMKDLIRQAESLEKRDETLNGLYDAVTVIGGPINSVFDYDEQMVIEWLVTEE